MTANELRIGNWVRDKYGDLYEVSKVTRGGNVKIFSAGEHRLTGLTKIKPIPITEEWLVKFGFDVFGNYEHTEAVKSSKDKIDFVLVKSQGSDWDFDDRVVIACVHQLQNLFFALTGEELTIKEQEEA